MIDVIALEKKWKIYKIKSFIPYIIIFVSSIVILLVLLFFFDRKNNEVNEKNITTINTPINNSVIIELPKIKKEVVQVKNDDYISKEKETDVAKKTVIISPSMDFMKKIEPNIMGFYSKEKDRLDDHKNVIAEKKVSEINDVEIVDKKVVNSVIIKRKDSYNDILEVVKRFNKNNNPALSLFIAKKYYELGNYSKSYDYALVTNDINSEIESSWILFAKSLVKLNKKEKAIIVLTRYIEHSNSNKAMLLLNDIKMGVFR